MRGERGWAWGAGTKGYCGKSWGSLFTSAAKLTLFLKGEVCSFTHTHRHGTRTRRVHTRAHARTACHTHKWTPARVCAALAAALGNPPTCKSHYPFQDPSDARSSPCAQARRAQPHGAVETGLASLAPPGMERAANADANAGLSAQHRPRSQLTRQSPRRGWGVPRASATGTAPRGPSGEIGAVTCLHTNWHTSGTGGRRRALDVRTTRTGWSIRLRKGTRAPLGVSCKFSSQRFER